MSGSLSVFGTRALAPIRRLLPSALAIVAASLGGPALAAPCAIWSQSRCDAQNSAAIELAVESGAQPRAWTFDGSGRVWGYEPGMTVWSPPSLGIVGDRAVLAVGSYDHTLYVLDAATGESLWKFTTGGPVYATPVFWRDGGRTLLFASSTDRLVYALDAESGRQVWVHSVEDYRPSLGGARLAAPCIGATGDTYDAVFVPYWVWDRTLANSLQKSGVLALSLTEGRPLWRQELGDNDLTAAIFVRSTGRNLLYLGSANGNVYSLDAATGQVLWKKTELDSVRGPPAFWEGSAGPLIITGSKFGTVRGLDATSGNERWAHRTGDRITGAVAVLPDARPPVALVDSYDRFMYSLDVERGALKWRYQARGGLYSSPAFVPATPAMALASGWDNLLHVVNLSDGGPVFSAFTGRPLWSVAGMDESTWSSPIAGRIRGHWMAFVGSYDGALRALPVEESDRGAPVLRSNFWFWMSFPLVLGPFVLLAVGLTRRDRARRLHLTRTR